MAEGGIQLDEDQFSCPVCLDLLKDPVAIPCGHSYCMDCIKGCWDQQDHVGVYSCSQCTQTFTSRPVLSRNTILAKVVEKLKKTEFQTAPPEHCFARPGDVMCDVCTGRKRKAVKSCLVCLVSHCETHLSLHEKVNPAKRHKLIDATKQLKEKVCSHHDKLLEVYCRTDQQCICLLCVMDEHRGHDTVSAAAGRTEKRKPLEVAQREFQQSIQRRQKKVQELRQAVDSLTRSAQAAVEDTESIFTEMICSLEKSRSELKDVIRAQEKAVLSPAQTLLELLEQEIAELRKRHSELEQLSHTEDHIHFLQSFQSLCVLPGPVHLPTITVSPHCSFGGMKKSLSDLKVQLEDACKNKFTEISQTVKKDTEDTVTKPSPLKTEENTEDTFTKPSPLKTEDTEDALTKPSPLRKEPRTSEEFVYYNLECCSKEKEKSIVSLSCVWSEGSLGFKGNDFAHSSNGLVRTDDLTSLRWLQEFSVSANKTQKTSSHQKQSHLCGHQKMVSADIIPLPKAQDPLSMDSPHRPGFSRLKALQKGFSSSSLPSLVNYSHCPQDVDYKTDPNIRPPYSYATLICMAMQANKTSKITLSYIYEWIKENFCYFRHVGPSWQNSIRHSLSVNKCFTKVPRQKGGPEKRGFWTIDPQYADQLLRDAYKKTRMSSVKINPALQA